MDPVTALDLYRLPADRPAVVILGGISLVRAAGLAGIPAIVATSDPHEPALASRHCHARYAMPRFDQPQAAVDALVALGDQLAAHYGRRVPLLYGSDDALELINAHRERLGRYFLLLLNDPEVSCALIAKDRFQAFARDRGLPVPPALAYAGDRRGTLRGTSGPVVAKPSTKLDWHHSPLCEQLFGGDGKARVFATGSEAAEHPVVAAFHRQLTFQEYIPGGDRELWSFHGFCDDRGEVLASFIGRKVRTYPIDTGESAYIEIAHDASLEAAGRAVARACPLKGVFKMDFKRDPRDGRWHLLEINARYTLWHYLAAVNGFNLTRMAVEYLLDARVPAPAQPARRYRWLSMQLDYRAWRALAARGELSLAGWIASLATSRKVYNLFAWSDPMPWLAFWTQRIARRLDRGPARMRTLLRQWRSTAS